MALGCNGDCAGLGCSAMTQLWAVFSSHAQASPAALAVTSARAQRAQGVTFCQCLGCHCLQCLGKHQQPQLAALSAVAQSFLQVTNL